MKIVCWSLLFCVLPCTFAQQAPWATPDVPISANDRVYAADQTSNTISVIDPSSNTLLGVIRLGDPVPGALSPLYKGELLVHGLGYSPDSKTLAVVSVASNSVTLIDTATNKIKGKVYVGRSPHEVFFTPDGRELWVTVRGENYVSVINPLQMKETRRIEMANGPGMTMFGPDGRYAFVCSSFTLELTVLDAAAHSIIKRVQQASRGLVPTANLTGIVDRDTIPGDAQIRSLAARPLRHIRGVVRVGGAYDGPGRVYTVRLAVAVQRIRQPSVERSPRNRPIAKSRSEKATRRAMRRQKSACLGSFPSVLTRLIGKPLA